MHSYLGWFIIIYRSKFPNSIFLTSETELGEELTRWEADLHGLQWIDDLVASGKASELLIGGYPNRYSVQFKFILPIINSDPPFIRSWSKLEINQSSLSTISPDEWFIIEAWDES